MKKWILWGFISLILLVFFWPLGLAALIIGPMLLLKDTTIAENKARQEQYMEDVHTIAEHMRQEKKEP